jgi:diguanylate cyclase (GGDEF)-like protein
VIGADRQASKTTGRQEFREGLKLLDRSTSWVLWSGILAILLLPGAVALLLFPRLPVRVGSFPAPGANLLVYGLIGLVWILNICTLVWQGRLKKLRKRLVEQEEAAAKQRARAEALYGLSILDPLTGLYNRRFGESRLREEIERAEKTGDPLLLMALDFDRFKEINDGYGHAVGDLALKAFARRLQRAIRACDVPIRLGGDEFLVILPECSQDKVQLILSRMDPVEVAWEGEKIPVFFSRGVAQYQVKDTPETMLARADQRLYAEKAKRATVAV